MYVLGIEPAPRLGRRAAARRPDRRVRRGGAVQPRQALRRVPRPGGQYCLRAGRHHASATSTTSPTSGSAGARSCTPRSTSSATSRRPWRVFRNDAGDYGPRPAACVADHARARRSGPRRRLPRRRRPAAHPAAPHVHPRAAASAPPPATTGPTGSRSTWSTTTSRTPPAPLRLARGDSAAILTFDGIGSDGTCTLPRRRPRATGSSDAAAGQVPALARRPVRRSSPATSASTRPRDEGKVMGLAAVRHRPTYVERFRELVRLEPGRQLRAGPELVPAPPHRQAPGLRRSSSTHVRPAPAARRRGRRRRSTTPTSPTRCSTRSRRPACTWRAGCSRRPG